MGAFLKGDDEMKNLGFVIQLVRQTIEGRMGCDCFMDVCTVFFGGVAFEGGVQGDEV